MDRRRILLAEEDAERLESLAWLFIKEDSADSSAPS
jgi:hypothetical protein